MLRWSAVGGIFECQGQGAAGSTADLYEYHRRRAGAWPTSIEVEEDGAEQK